MGVLILMSISSLVQKQLATTSTEESGVTLPITLSERSSTGPHRELVHVE
jgi:hypothetical protein